MDRREEEKVMAGLLRRGLRNTANASAGECPEPAILAAYFESALDAWEAARWETHFSCCERCQQQLAALAQLELAEVLVEHVAAAAAQPIAHRAQPAPGFWRMHWRWLTAAAVGLSAAALWLVIRPVPVRQPAPLQQTQQPLALATPAASPSAAPNTSKLEPSPPARARSRAEALPKLDRTQRLSNRPALRAGEQVAAKKALVLPDAAPAQPVGALAGATEQSRSQALYKSAEALPVPAPPRSGLHAAPRAKVMVQESLTGAAGAAPSQTSQALAPMAPAVRSREMLIRSPDPDVMWRFGTEGTIERTGDGGKTWQGQFAPKEVRLLAGSAPSDKVCWMVGSDGAILRTTDGEKWEKINSPTGDPLVKIEAMDARTATIFTAGEQSYLTHDGGLTWAPK